MYQLNSIFRFSTISWNMDCRRLIFFLLFKRKKAQGFISKTKLETPESI